MTKKQADVREIVLDMLIETCENGMYSHLVLSAVLQKYQYLDVKQRKFMTRLFEGTVEYQLQEDAVLDRYSKVKTNKMKPIIRNILRMGVYQLLHMDSVPYSAVCNECVKLAKKRGFAGLSGFVNGVIRNIARDKDNIHFDSLSELYSVPEWIIDEWYKVYDKQTVNNILHGFCQRKGLSIRCYQSRIDCDDFFSHLERQGVTVKRNQYILDAAWISDFENVESIYGYREGYFQIQDSSAMYPAIISGVKDGFNVLDVCAAPGGKALQFADLLKESGKVEARDISEYKIQLIDENIFRSGMKNIDTVCKDALCFDENSKEVYDIVLADLPCSGLGVIGKKSDIRYRIMKKDIENLSEIQRDILSIIWQYVKPGGTLIYSTCTISKMENEDNVKWFTDNFPFVLEGFENFIGDLNDAATSKDGYLQLLPGVHNGDGAFMAKLRREA